MIATLTLIGIITTVILNVYQIYIQRKAMASTAKTAVEDVIKKL